MTATRPMLTFRITDHAVRQYQERIYKRLTPAQAVREIEDALSNPVFVCPNAAQTGLLWGVRNRGGMLFIALTNAAGTALDVLTVGPCWYWHEAHPYYRPLMKSRRRWT